MSILKLTLHELDRLLTDCSLEEEPPAVTLDSTFFGLLTSSGRELITQVMTECHCEPGQVIFGEGEPGDAMYIILSGRVAVVKGDLPPDGENEPYIIGYRGAGEAIGEMALLEDRPRSASIVALENLRLLKMTREDFHQVLNDNPEISAGLLRKLSARLRASDDARRTSALAERRLATQVSELQTEQRQLREIERLRRETGEFIIHDLRGPLSIAFGAIETLLMVLPEEVVAENRELLLTAEANCERMKRLVDSLLSTARMESGEDRLVLSPVNLKRCLEEAVNQVAAILKARQAAIGCIVPADLPIVVADEEKLDRVLANLIDNAIKYTAKDARITVAAESCADYVRVSVTDTGLGILPEYRERIFDRFAQVSGGKPARGGWGLGLAFCRQVVEAHGGKIWVEPGDQGVGSRFVFTLPLSSISSSLTASK